MSRIRLLILAIALLVGAEPVVHTHPLNGSAYDGGTNGATLCACAASAQQITTDAPVLVTPQTTVSDVAVFTASSVSHGVALTLPSRAPPAA